MVSTLSVHLLPELFRPEEVSGGIAVVIDILRASTTICHALEAGANSVVPCLSVEEARELKLQRPEVLLGGERGGVVIEGFDLDNSPRAYTAERVAGKTIVFTTSNGTKALLRCREAEAVVVGAFSNISAVVESLISRGLPIHLVCAGTNGAITGEDVLFAGAVVEKVLANSPTTHLANDSAQIAAQFWTANSESETTFKAAMHGSRGGRNLTQLGLAADIETACQQDLFNFVPVWDSQSNTIQPAHNLD